MSDAGMQLDSVAQTARMVAAARARETSRDDALFRDPLAERLAGPEGFAVLEASERSNPTGDGVSTYMVLRTRFLDDQIVRAAGEGIRQVVMVAAGMDSRAFRLPWPSGVTLWELDRPDLLALKDQLLGDAQPACQRVPVGVDLEYGWTEAILAARFDPARPTLWVTEGLFYYLEEAAVRRILSGITALSSPGSRLVGDLVSASFLTCAFLQEALRAMAERGHPWVSGTDEPEAFLSEFGWKAHVVQPGEPDGDYGRWVYPPPPPRSVPQMPRMFFFSSEYAESR